MTREPTPIEELRQTLRDMFVKAARQAGFPAELIDAALQDDTIAEIVRRHTDAWEARHRVSPSVDDHPLQEPRFGHQTEVRLPFTPETADEQDRRQRRTEGFMWAMRAASLARKGKEVAEPPPELVTVLELLEQATWWRQEATRTFPTPTPGDGLAPFTQPAIVVTTRPVRLDQMTHSHRLNLLGWLQARQGVLHNQAVSQLFAAISGPLGPRGDMACDGADRELDELRHEPPGHWLARQPLVRALVRWTTVWVDDPKLAWHPADDRRDRPEDEPGGYWADLFPDDGPGSESYWSMTDFDEDIGYPSGHDQHDSDEKPDRPDCRACGDPLHPNKLACNRCGTLRWDPPRLGLDLT